MRLLKTKDFFRELSASQIVDHLNTFNGRNDIRNARAVLNEKGYDTFYDSYLERYCLA